MYSRPPRRHRRDVSLAPADSAARKRTTPVEGLCWSACRHQASSSPQGDGRPCLSGCTVQTTKEVPHRCRKRRVPPQPGTGQGSCGAPWASRKPPWPCASCTTGGGLFLRGWTCFILACLLAGGDARPVRSCARATSMVAAVGACRLLRHPARRSA